MTPSLVNGGHNLVDDSTFESMLIDTFTPQTSTTVYTDLGGETKTWTDGDTFEGRLSILKAWERIGPDKETAIASHKIYCLTSVTISAAGRITLGSRTFEVKAVQKPSNLDTDGHLEITVLEIDP